MEQPYPLVTKWQKSVPGVSVVQPDSLLRFAGILIMTGFGVIAHSATLWNWWMGVVPE